MGEQLLVRTSALADIAAGAEHLEIAILIAAPCRSRHDVINVHDAERKMRPASLAVPLLLTIESMRVGPRWWQLPLIRARRDVYPMDYVEEQTAKLALDALLDELDSEIGEIRPPSF